MGAAHEGKWTTVTAALMHQRSLHIDAPVEVVFNYLADPVHFVAGMAPDHQASAVAVHRTQDGSVSSFDVRYFEMGRDQGDGHDAGAAGCQSSDRVPLLGRAGPCVHC